MGYYIINYMVNMFLFVSITLHGYIYIYNNITIMII